MLKHYFSTYTKLYNCRIDTRLQFYNFMILLYGYYHFKHFTFKIRSDEYFVKLEKNYLPSILKYFASKDCL